MPEVYKTILPSIGSYQNHQDPTYLNNQETENSLILNYEKRLDAALELSWASNKAISSDDYEDISGIRECFDDQRYLRENPPIIEAIEKGIVSSAWEHWIQYGQMQRRFAKFNLPFEVLNDRNLGKDLYIFLDRDHVYGLNIESKKYLSTKTTIDFANFDINDLITSLC